MVDQVILERFDNVLEKGRQLLLSLGEERQRGQSLAQQPFAEWRTQSLTLLEAIFGPKHPYTSKFEATTAYPKAIEAMPVFAENGLGTLQAAAEDVRMGWTWQFKELVHADVFTDFLDMADYLISEGNYKDAAAVLAGGVLEEHLRQLCRKHQIAITAGRHPKKASKMNDELSQLSVYSRAEWRSVQAWLDLRNDPAHGKYGHHATEQVKAMIQGIRDFSVRHPA